MRFVKLTAALLGLAATVPAFAKPEPVPPPPVVAPPVVPDNVLDLDLSTGGRVSIVLRPDKAPASVARIRTLVRRGFYNGLVFHRVIEGFMAQGGDPKGTGEGGSDLPDLKAEFNDLPHVRGVIAMARAESVDSANSQFYIMLSPNFQLDRRYTVIGRVSSGMQYVDALEKGEPPANPSKIVRATIAGDAGRTPAEIAAAEAADAAIAPAAPIKAENSASVLSPKAVKTAEKARKKADKQRLKEEKAAAKQAKRTVAETPAPTAPTDAPDRTAPAGTPPAEPAATIDDPVPTGPADPTPPQR